tara:strand:+ start:63 stop:419 length:357 start_codon:yes stop_codon:yes gene_type:complete
MEDIMLNIRDFICLHYITPRKEIFWKTQIMPDSLKDRLELFKTRLPIREDFCKSQYFLFREAHYIVVMHGLGLIHLDKIKKQYSMLNNNFKELIQIKYEDTYSYIPHKEWLRKVRNEI